MLYNNNILSNHYEYLLNEHPFSVFVKITNNCMLNCSFCSQGESKHIEMDFKFAKDLLLQLKNFGIIRVFYTGGEPFMYSNFLDLLKYGKTLSLYQCVVTNGCLLSSPHLKECLNYVNGISISLHGREKTHNAITKSSCYEKVISNIKYLRNAYPNIYIDICYTATDFNTNYKDLQSVANICKSLGIKLNVTRVFQIGKGQTKDSKQLAVKLLTLLKKLRSEKRYINFGHCSVGCYSNNIDLDDVVPCNAGIESCAIETNGDVTICGNSTDILGNLYSSSLQEIWENNNEILKSHIRNCSLICKNCAKFVRCIGGCKCEIGKTASGCNDVLVNELIEESWDKIKKFHFKTGIAKIVQNKDKYVLIGCKNVIIDQEAYNLIKKMSFDKTFEQNLLKYDFSELKSIKEIFILLVKDNMLRVVSNE